MRLAERTEGLTASPTMAVDARAKALVRQGVDVVSFSVGEPDFDTPEIVKEAALDAMRRGRTKYTAVQGLPELREAVAENLAEELHLAYPPDRIVVSNGAKQSIFNALFALVGPGDEVILPAPYWVSYPEQIRLAGATPVIVPTDVARGFHLDLEALEAAIGPRTRVILLNTPSNPTGTVLERSELEAVAELALRHDLWIISDEIYRHLVFGAEHVSVAQLGDEVRAKTILVDGVSKAYAMTGWRIGWAVSEDPALVEAMTAIQSHLTSAPSTVSQWAAVVALRQARASVDEMVAEFDRRRRRMVELVRQTPGFELAEEPRGAFYVFPSIRGLVGSEVGGRRVYDADDLAELLLEEAHVAVVPGSGFGLPEYLRLSYATSLERMEEGFRRLASVLRVS
ncbi:MAG: pyridoxal phosphate-dependent aminotransferase [Bacillota bacterium]|nr:pyridoxal phosphate-dependent aminotransferase [Bacillota bacterium]